MPPLSSKQLVRSLFQRKELSRPPFIPLVTSFAARLAQIPVRELLINPTRLANTLQATQRLLGHDAIVGVYDPAIEAEACGCLLDWSAEDRLPTVIGHPLAEGKPLGELDLDTFHQRGRIPVALEAMKRIAMVAGREVGVVGVVTGPITLCRHLCGDAFLDQVARHPEAAGQVLEAAGSILTTMVRLYCDLKTDAILVADEWIDRVDRGWLPRIAPAYRSAANIVRYYDAAFLVLPGQVIAAHHGNLCQLESDAFILSGEHLPDALGQLAKEGRSFGAAMPESIMSGSKEDASRAIRRYLGQGNRRGFFISTNGEVPHRAPVENLQEIMEAIKQTPVS